VCIVVVVLCVLLSYVYLLYCVGIAVFTLDAGLLARSQYPEGPAIGHLDTGFSSFPCDSTDRNHFAAHCADFRETNTQLILGGHIV